MSRERDEIWDTVAAIWFGGTVAIPDQKRVGRIVKLLKQHGATAEQIRERVERYRQSWPNAACTPEAVTKHWAFFGAVSGPVMTPNAFRAAMGDK